MPDEAGYRVWRETVELSIVSNSGRCAETKVFVEKVAQSDPVYLAQNCPHDMKNLDSKIACSVRLIMKGIVADRVAIELNKLCGA